MTTKNILLSGGDGTQVPAGYIGEKITWVTPPVSQTLTTSLQDWTNASIVLTPGTWLIIASISTKYFTGTTAAADGYTQVRITDSSNNTVQEQENILSAGQSPGTYSIFNRGTLSFSFIATLSAASTVYKIRAAKGDNNGTGVGAVENDTLIRSRFFAVRIN